MSEQTFRYFVLTGPPGVGKTTVVKKICNVLREKQLAVNGFFTEEIRSEGRRIGFDVVLMNGKRAPLARVKSFDRTVGPSVGQYEVDVKSFESCVLPVLHTHDEKSILVLDEIGKMELFSEGFKRMVTKFIRDRSFILATIPIKTVKPIPLVETLKAHPETILITVDRENRNLLPDKMVKYIIEAAKKEFGMTI